jgi:ATP phosphoribosyltransferase regulatory subunit
LLYATGEFETAIERLNAIDAGGALASRIRALREIAARVGASAKITLDPSERHGFEYQSWFGFMLYADGVRGSLGRGGTYTIANATSQAAEVATGFSLYPDGLIAQLAETEAAGDLMFLPLGHDRDAAARLRAIGWRTVAALGEGDAPAALGCTHRLEGVEPVAL